MAEFKSISDNFAVKQRLEYRKIQYWANLKNDSYKKFDEAVNCIQFSQASQHFAMSTGFQVEIRDPLANNAVVKSFHRFKSPVRTLSLRADGGLLCVGETSGRLTVFNANSRAELRKMTEHSAAVSGCAFLAGVPRLATCAEDARCLLWDVATGQLASEFELTASDKATALDASCGDCNLLACGLSDGRTLLLDARQRAPVLSLEHGFGVAAVRLSPADNALFVAGDAWVRAFSLHQRGRQIAAFKRHHKHVASLCVNAEHGALLSAGLDGLVKVTDLLTYEEVHKFEYPNCSLLAMGLSRDARHLALGSGDRWLLTRKFSHPEAGEQQQQRQQQLAAKKRQSAAVAYWRQVRADRVQPARPEDIVDQPPAKRQRLSAVDKLFKAFRHSDALSQVIRSGQLRERPLAAAAVVRELQRRGALAAALAGRSEQEVGRLLKFALHSLGAQSLAPAALPLAADLVDIYAGGLASRPGLRNLFEKLRALLSRELTLARNILPTVGRMSLLLDCSSGQLGAAL